MPIVVKKLFGILGRRRKPAQTGLAVAHPPVLQATEISLWGLQPQILFNNFFRLMAVRIQRILPNCRFCIYYWPKDAVILVQENQSELAIPFWRKKDTDFITWGQKYPERLLIFPLFFPMSTVTSAVLGKSACLGNAARTPQTSSAPSNPRLTCWKKSRVHLSYCSLC